MNPVFFIIGLLLCCPVSMQAMLAGRARELSINSRDEQPGSQSDVVTAIPVALAQDVVLYNALSAEHRALLADFSPKDVAAAGQALKKKNDPAHKAFFECVTAGLGAVQPEQEYMAALFFELREKAKEDAQQLDVRLKGKKCRIACMIPVVAGYLSCGVYSIYYFATLSCQK